MKGCCSCAVTIAHKVSVRDDVQTIVRPVLLACAAGRTTDATLRRESASHLGKGAPDSGSSRATPARKRDAPGADAEPGTAVEKAIGMASAAGSWAMEASDRHGKRLLQIGRDWLAGGTRQDEARLEDAALGENGAEQHARGVVADAVTEKEGQLRPSKEGDSSAGGSACSARQRSAPGGAGSDTERHGEEAWRRGSLDGQDKRR